MRGRRLAFCGLVGLVLWGGGCQGTKAPEASGAAGAVGAAVQTKESQAAMTPQEALARLRAGNARFVAGRPERRDLPAEVRATAAGQYPFAVILNCVDSRQPAETIFDLGLGDVFNVRLAGNVLDDDALGSMEFGCQVAGSKLIVVLGHSDCGAIKGAIDNVELGNLSGLLEKIKPAIAEASAGGQGGTSKDAAFVQKVADANVQVVMREIRERSPILRELIDQGKVGLVGGMYDLKSGNVRFYAE